MGLPGLGTAPGVQLVNEKTRSRARVRSPGPPRPAVLGNSLSGAMGTMAASATLPSAGAHSSPAR